MSGKSSIRRRLDSIEEDLGVSDSYVDVKIVFDDAMKIEGMEDPIVRVPKEKMRNWMRGQSK